MSKNKRKRYTLGFEHNPRLVEAPLIIKQLPVNNAPKSNWEFFLLYIKRNNLFEHILRP